VEALSLLEKEASRIDLVFSDIVMAGGISGVDLNRHIVEKWPRVKVLLTSGYTEMAVKSRAEVAVEIIAKPYRMADLAHRIRDTLDA
jgi:two-component system, NtrC family, sensor kinase